MTTPTGGGPVDELRRTGQPFSLGDIEYWRHEVAHRDVDPSIQWADVEVTQLVGRWIATLDAATPPPAGEPDYREDGGRLGDWVVRHSVDPAGDGALDVERLARALHGDPKFGRFGGRGCVCRQEAPKVAERYARLAAEAQP